jgi:hypothetical protein
MADRSPTGTGSGCPLGLLDNLNAAALTVGLVTLAVMAWFLYRRTRTPTRPAGAGQPFVLAGLGQMITRHT